MHSELRDRLMEGDRRVVGASGTVADQVLQDNALLQPLISLLEDDNAAVVAHTAHALMQVAMKEPARFDPHIEPLLSHLKKPRQWEIGEQLPKILVRTAVTDDQAGRLADILVANTQDKSNIVAACSLQGLVDLARDGRIDKSKVEHSIEAALVSDRKALAARARQLQKIVQKL